MYECTRSIRREHEHRLLCLIITLHYMLGVVSYTKIGSGGVNPHVLHLLDLIHGSFSVIFIFGATQALLEHFHLPFSAKKHSSPH